MLHRCAGDDLLQIGFLNLGIHTGEQPLEQSPCFETRRDIEIRHLQARDLVCRFDIFLPAQTKIFFESPRWFFAAVVLAAVVVVQIEFVFLRGNAVALLCPRAQIDQPATF